MSTPEPVLFPLDELFAALESRGFYLGVDTHLRLREYLDWFLQHTGRNPRTLKYQLAALLCRDAAGQEQFYTLFDQHLAPFLSGASEKKPGESGEKRRAGTSAGMPEQEKEQPESAPAGAGARSTQPVLTEGKSGPVRVELKFPTNDLRIWNLAEMDQAVRPLREKEWATVLEWDIPATIRSTIRAGGMPTFELRRRKRAPQYLMLIDQRGPRDHLAGLYAELAAELNRRDVDTVHYFYDRSPRRCWKDRRDYGTYTTIEYLQGEFPGSRLLLVGEPEALLDLPQLRPSNLAADLLDAWPNTALLCTRPTAEWDNAELALCQLMPVVPANAAGLAALTGQWAAVSVHPPAYWKIQSPEATVPPVRVTRPQEAEKVLENLRYYLGRDGYFWLCAAALYPELYYELTALLHDESIPPPPGLPPGDWDMNRVWWTHLLRLSRLDWFRRGSIPLPAREQLRQFFDNRVSPEQRQKVWEQLARLLEFTDAPPGSFAADSLQVTLDWYNTEHQTADPLLTETAKQQLREAFQSRAQTAALNDPLARRIVLQPEPARQPQILFSGITTPDTLNVRSGPSASSAIIDKLPAATPVSVFEVSSDNAWYRIGENRWVNAGYVETTKQAPPPPAAAFRILWVDDNPDNNREERAVLQERFGVSITIATNTEDALSRLSGQTFDLVVSDAVRGDDYEAGMKLLSAMRQRGSSTPFLVYTGVTNFEYFQKVFAEAGAVAVVQDARSLQEVVEQQINLARTQAAAPPESNIGTQQRYENGQSAYTEEAPVGEEPAVEFVQEETAAESEPPAGEEPELETPAEAETPQAEAEATSEQPVGKTEPLEKIRQLIVANRLGDALQALTQALPAHLKNDALVLQTQLQDLERNERLGMIGFSEAGIQRAKITNAALGLVGQIGTAAPPTASPPAGEEQVASGSTAKLAKMKILFLTANPTDTTRIQTDKEYRVIVNELEKSPQRDNIQILRPKFSVTLSELREVIKDEPNIIHFTGHGDPEGIIVSTEDNTAQIVSSTALQRLFRPLKGILQIIVLNAGYSAALAKDLSESGPYVIGHNMPISDPAAISFSRGFYYGLGQGKDFHDTFTDAMVFLLSEDPSAAPIIEVWKDGQKLDL